MKITYTREAGETEIQEQITKLAMERLDEAFCGDASIECIQSVDVTEGAEDCGSGTLHITGLFLCGKNRYGAVTPGHLYRIDSTGSQWRNYGAPSGMKYDITVSLIPLAPESRNY